jgi:PAS domain S-box-containing protein
MSGIVFGSYLYFLQYIDNQVYIFFTVLLLGALSSGSVSTHSTSMTAFTIFNMLSLFPYAVYFIFSLKKDYTPVGLLIFLFLITIFITAFRISKILTRSLSLSIENDAIIEKLSQSEEKFSKSFYSGIAPMAMLRFDNARFMDANNAMINLIKYSKEEIIGKSPYDLDLYQKPEDAIDIIVEASKSGRLSNREITLTTGDGKIIHCLVTVENFRLNDSIIALVMLQDFTDRIEYEKQLKFERDRAETAASAKARFLATMSHEIRTPMNAILGMTNLAMLSENAEERNEYLSVVKDSGNYLMVLINDILDMSKIESGNVKIDLTDTDLNKLITSVYRNMELLALSKKLTFTKEINPDVPEYIKSAPERLRQILINLIGNSIKFTGKGGISLNVALSDGKGYKHDSDALEFIEFSVTDTGIGIPEDKHEIIFDSFTQADASTFRKFGGTGLGLSICRQIIKLMKGDIKVSSEPGKGSTFSFIIPLITGEKPSTAEIGLYANHEHKESTKILIAEDNIMNQKLIEAYMKKLEVNYTLAENGIDAIEKLKNDKFDMVLMDLEMPVMDGYEAMRRIRAGEAGTGNTHIIIYAMSAHILKETIKKCIDDGFSGYIIKPLDLKRLKDIF